MKKWIKIKESWMKYMKIQKIKKYLSLLLKLRFYLFHIFIIFQKQLNIHESVENMHNKERK